MLGTVAKIRGWLYTPWVNLVLWAVSIVITVTLTYQSIGRKSPSYAVSNSYLYVDAHQDRDLSVLWKDKKIKRAYLTYVALWNNGNVPVEAQDIPLGSPIRIEALKPVHLLHAQATGQRSNLGLEADTADKYIHVYWHDDEALERDDGGVIRIIYEADRPVDFTVTGRVKGTSTGFVRRGGSTLGLGQFASRTILAIGIFAALIAIILYLTSNRLNKNHWEKMHTFVDSQSYAASLSKSSWVAPLLILLVGILFIWISGISWPSAPTWADDIVRSHVISY